MPENRSRFVLLCQQSLALGLVAAVAVPAAQLVTLDIVSPGTPNDAPSARPAPGAAVETESVVATAPVRPTTRSVPLNGVSEAGLAALGEPTASGAPGGTARLSAADVEPGTHAGDRLAVLSAPQSVDGLSTVGVTWGEGAGLPEDAITVSVRTQKNGVWSAWTPAPYHEEEGPDPASAEGGAARPGTDPVYVGAVDDVQVKAVTDDGAAPEDMSLAVVDPGQAVSESEGPSIDTGAMALSAAGTSTDAADEDVELSAGSTAAKPTIYSRAQWGADERMRDKSSLRYAKVTAGFVHHTVNANSYTEAQVPSILRGIYAYHTQSRGWSDVGYNFLVDRFGRIWEGRYGGVDKAVVGAHTSGYNDYAFAMSAIGNFEQVQPSSALLDAYGRLFAWKLGLSGISASATRQWVGKRYLPAINGHRDVGQTACPGAYLFAKIPAIRSLAAGYQKAKAPTTTPTPPPPDMSVPAPSERDRDTNLLDGAEPEIVVRDRATKEAFVVQTGGTPVAYGAGSTARDIRRFDLVTATGDLDGDGKDDVLARGTSSKQAYVLPGDGAGKVGAQTAPLPQFSGADQLLDAGDWNGDGLADVVARDRASKSLNLYLGDGRGRFAAAKRLATAWSYGTTVGGGDFTGDGRPDLVARSADGRLVVLPGTGTGAGAVRVVSTGWTSLDLLAGLDDLTNDGRRDLVARVRSSGRTVVYRGNGAGGYLPSPVAAPTADGRTVVGTGRFIGSAAPDLLVRDPSNRLVTLANNGGTAVGLPFPTGRTLAAADLVMVAGDWDDDGAADVITRSGTSGALYLYRGTGKGTLAAPVRMASGFADVRLLAAVGDLTGDGRPDLVGQPSSGSMRVYPSDGSTGFSASKVTRSAVTSTVAQQLGIGRWDADPAPDTVLRRSGGRLVLNRGTSAGALTPNSGGLGTVTSGYDWAVAGGDVTGDGRPDLLVREKATGVLWGLPGTSSGLGTRRQLVTGLSRFDLAG